MKVGMVTSSVMIRAMMHHTALWFPKRCFFVFLLLPVCSLHAQDWRNFKVKSGDEIQYASPGFADDEWPGYRQWRETDEGKRYKGNLWMRGQLTFGEHPPGTSYGMAILAVSTCEVYLDGQLIAANGKVGSGPEDERAGRTIFVVAIPPELHTPGRHQLALRFSNHHGNFHFGIIGMGYGKLNEIIERLRGMLLPLVLSSAFFMVAIYFFLLYLFSYREPAFALFAILSTLVGMLYVAEQWRLVGYTYHLHYQRLLMIVCLSAGVNLLLPLFFMYMHRLSRIYALFLPVLMAVSGFLFGDNPDGVSYGFFLSGLAMAQLLSARALWLRRPHAHWGFVGCVIAIATLIWSGRDFLEGPFFYCFILMILLMMISLSLQIREARRNFQEARLTSARLETELLQKHIQPHFMLNTLTAAMEWVERDPPAAVRFIDALATEMRSLFTASGRSLILLSEELALCRAHLETQSFRTGQKHDLEVEGKVDGVMVPPAVFLTLLENGLTHGSPDCAYHFHLKIDLEGTHFCFEVDHQASDDDDNEGTGSRYIKARLEESFPGRWQFRTELDGSIWRSTIIIEKP